MYFNLRQDYYVGISVKFEPYLISGFISNTRYLVLAKGLIKILCSITVDKV